MLGQPSPSGNGVPRLCASTGAVCESHSSFHGSHPHSTAAGMLPHSPQMFPAGVVPAPSWAASGFPPHLVLAEWEVIRAIRVPADRVLSSAGADIQSVLQGQTPHFALPTLAGCYKWVTPTHRRTPHSCPRCCSIYHPLPQESLYPRAWALPLQCETSMVHPPWGETPNALLTALKWCAGPDTAASG